MSRHSKRDWEETVSGERHRCVYCPFAACQDCPDKGGQQ